MFGISNGTCQGSVLSPAFFAIYLDALFHQLGNLGDGCYVGDKFVGEAGFPDDIAPSQGAMELRLSTCEEFDQENNLIFYRSQPSQI